MYGNIFQQATTLEDVIRVKEVQLELFPTSANREELKKVETEMKKWLRVEEEFWQQKVRMKWLKDVDRN